MSRHTFIIAAMALCFLPTAQAPAATSTTDGPPTISLTKLEVTDKSLEVSYEIKNGSGQDIWLCEGINASYRNFEVAMHSDGQTLLIRRRSNVPMSGYGELPSYHYIRICRGCNLEESLLLSLPVHPWRVILGGRISSKGIERLKRITLEIGYFSGNLPCTIVDMLEEAEKDPRQKHVDDIGYPTDTIGWLDSSVSFNRDNEGIQDRDERVVIPWTNQSLKGEQVLQTTIDDLHIPYIERTLFAEPKLHDLDACTRIEIKYEPSMFDYFFPYNFKKSLLNTQEISHLQSHNTVVLDNRELIRELADQIKKGFCRGQIIRESRYAHVICYHGEQRITSFTIYGDASIETEDKQYL